jgi:hypothetical protein
MWTAGMGRQQVQPQFILKIDHGDGNDRRDTQRVVSSSDAILGLRAGKLCSKFSISYYFGNRKEE